MEQKQMTQQELFQNAAGLANLIIMSVGLFWTLCNRQFGTIGWRLYNHNLLWAMLILAVLIAGTQGLPDYEVLHGFMILLLVNFTIHRVVTLYKMRKGHVHSYALGTRRKMVTITGFLLGVILIFAGGVYAGGFLLASIFCDYVTDDMFRMRDRRRMCELQDAFLEQRRMEEMFNEAGIGGRV